MKLVVGSDHVGLPLKRHLIEYLKQQGHEIIDVGADSEERTDYGMLLTPVWVINFNAGGDEQGATGRYAIFDAIDGHLIDGNWM